MQIESLNLKNFRTYENENILFSPTLNIIYGKNGQGKTNIIEAIYYFSIGKSFKNIKDKETIKFGCDFSLIEASFLKEKEKINSKIYIKEKKSISQDGVLIEKLSEIIGNINICIFTPDHLKIIKDGPNLKRNFLDNLISSVKPLYFKNLINYYKVLKNRNLVLKQGKNLEENLDIWDNELSKYIYEIAKDRRDFINLLNEKVKIKDFGDEILDIRYVMSIKNSLNSQKDIIKELKEKRNKDIETKITNYGIHRDDLSFYIDNKDLKNFGSQGQIRTSVLKLKLAECEIIKEFKDTEPILLLDDVLSELDYQRKKIFLEKLKDKQTIITCTSIDEELKSEAKLIKVENGKIFYN